MKNETIKILEAIKKALNEASKEKSIDFFLANEFDCSPDEVNEARGEVAKCFHSSVNMIETCKKIFPDMSDIDIFKITYLLFLKNQ